MKCWSIDRTIELFIGEFVEGAYVSDGEVVFVNADTGEINITTESIVKRIENVVILKHGIDDFDDMQIV